MLEFISHISLQNWRINMHDVFFVIDLFWILVQSLDPGPQLSPAARICTMEDDILKTTDRGKVELIDFNRIRCHETSTPLNHL